MVKRPKGIPKLAYIIGAAAVVVIIVAVILLVGGNTRGTVITLEDGASISVPRGAISPDASVNATALNPENGPEPPPGFTIESLYEFDIDEAPAEPVTLRLPLPSIAEDSVCWLAKYDESAGTWRGVALTVDDGYAVVQTDTLSVYATMTGAWDDFANWARETAGTVGSWARSVLAGLNLDNWISWYEDVMGADEMIYDPLTSTSPELECDDSASKGLISASAVLVGKNDIEIRVRNNGKMYLHLYFDGSQVKPVKRGYLALTDILEFVETTPGMKSLVKNSFQTNSVILLPECTADFRAYMNEGETLTIRVELSDAAALLNALDPAFALVPGVDLEVVTAVRDIKGAESDFYQALTAYEGEWMIQTYYALNIVEEMLRAGWLVGSNVLKSVASAYLLEVPTAAELADESIDRAEDIVNKGGDALSGGTIVISYPGKAPAVQYRLTISSSDGGSVTNPGEGIFTYDAGAAVRLVATAASGHRFVSWTGDVGRIANAGASATTITMNDNYSVTASFGEGSGYAPMVAAGREHTVGLKSDGTVVAVGHDGSGECDVSGWSNIVQVAATLFNTIGLRSDGTVVGVGYDFRPGHGMSNVVGWTDIVQVAIGCSHVVGLKSDGTVVAVGDNSYGQRNVGDWRDIVQVAAGCVHTVGLRSDGTVVAVGTDYNDECTVSGWTDIIQVAACQYHTAGVRSDGSVVVTGFLYYGSYDCRGWTGIVQVAGGERHLVGLKSDGTVVAVGENTYGRCNVDRWAGIVEVSASTGHTVGLKADGTVVAVGWNQYGQCDVGDWDLN